VQLTLPSRDNGPPGDDRSRPGEAAPEDFYTGLELSEGLNRGELLQFISVADEKLGELFAQRRSPENVAALNEEIRRVAQLKERAAERLLASESLTEETRDFALRTRLQALSHRAATGDLQAGDDLEKYAESLLNHPNEEIAIDSRSALLSLALDRLQGGLDENPKQVLRLAQQLTARPEWLNVAAVKVAERALQVLSRYGYAEAAEQVQQWLTEAIAAADNRAVQQVGADVLASIRFEALQLLRAEALQNGPQPPARWREEAEQVAAESADAVALNYLATLTLQLESVEMLPAARAIYDVISERFAASPEREVRLGAKLAVEAFERRQAAIGQPLPQLPTQTLSGDPLDWRAFRGEIVLMPFWSSQQPDSLSALADARRYAEGAVKPIRIVGVSLDADAQARRAAERLARQRLEFPNLVDAPQGEDAGPSLAEALGIVSLPVVVVVDPQGRVAKVALGQPQVDRAVEQIALP
jgi:peroxiredoxin